MLVGREKETEQLLRALDKPEAQLIAVYGRRCIGKTYLIRETFGKLFTSQHAGAYGYAGRRPSHDDHGPRPGTQRVC